MAGALGSTNSDSRQVALLIQSGSAASSAVLVTKQAHDIDSNLWELPTLSLDAADDENERQMLEEQAKGDPALQQEGAIDALVCAKKLMDQLARKLNPGRVTFQPLKLIIEPEFGPGDPVQTVVIKAEVEADWDKLDKQSLMMVTLKRTHKWLSEGAERAFPMIGPLALQILLSNQPTEASLPPERFQGVEGGMEYPPGFLLLPLRSPTLPPFKTTTLVVYAPASAYRTKGSAAKIEITEAPPEAASEGPARDSDKSGGSAGAAESASGASRTERGGASTSGPKPPLPKTRRNEFEEETPTRDPDKFGESAGGAESASGTQGGVSGRGRGRFDPLRKLPSSAKEKRAQDADSRRQKKAESLRSVGEKRRSGTRIRGTCLMVDPGGKTDSEGRKQVSSVVTDLPGPPVVFVTHHHVDHVKALTIVERHSPEALVVGHEKTLARIQTVAPNLRRHAVRGGDVLSIAGQDVLVVSAPGHTDGHLALFHPPSRMLIAGDHCVGHGSAVLDADAGADMQEYFDTTERFQELRPRLLVPMHGRPSFTPRAMLRQYKEHRQKREEEIHRAIQNGARTMLDVLRTAYADTPRYMWPAAASNALLHVGRLQKQGKLPQDFDVDDFRQGTLSTSTHLRLVGLMAGEALGMEGSRGRAVAWTLGVASVGIAAIVVFRWRGARVDG